MRAAPRAARRRERTAAERMCRVFASVHQAEQPVAIAAADAQAESTAENNLVVVAAVRLDPAHAVQVYNGRAMDTHEFGRVQQRLERGQCAAQRVGLLRAMD